MKNRMLKKLVLFAFVITAVHAEAKRSKHSAKSPTNAPAGISAGGEYFQPHLRLSGIGVDRESLISQPTLLELRTKNIIATQTFGIMRNQDGTNKDALVWAKRLTADELQKIISTAAEATHFPKNLLEGLIFIESGGDENAESPTGPLGIMQMTRATGIRIGIKIHFETRYKMVPFTPKGKKKKTVMRKVAYKVIVEDERKIPAVAIPIGAQFLEHLAENYHQQYKISLEAARQFAIWAYHSGEGPVNRALALAKKAGIKDPTMAKIFFGNSPGYNQKLFELIQHDLTTDYGPTYYFRVVRAGELLELYRSDPKEYVRLMQTYKSRVPGIAPATTRLDPWNYSTPMLKNIDELKEAIKKNVLVSAPDNPKYFSYALRRQGGQGIGSADLQNRDLFATDTPEVIGALETVAFETRRCWEQARSKGEKFIPLEVTSMIRTLDYQELLHHSNPNSRTKFPSHTIGAVDVAFATLPKTEQKCVRFVVQDIGFDEYLGYFDEHEAQKTLHFAPSPHHADFFLSVYNEAQEAYKKHPH